MEQEAGIQDGCWAYPNGDKSLKKTKKFAKPVNEVYLKELEEKKEKEGKQAVDVVICNALAAEMDEMWNFYHDKFHQVWLWWAVDHATNMPLTYVFGTREHKYLDELLKLLEPFSFGTVYADNHFAYSSKIPDHQLVTGKNSTQRMERDHLTLRTRLVTDYELLALTKIFSVSADWLIGTGK